MDTIDRDMATRVWQRVTAGRQDLPMPPENSLTLTDLLRRESENAAAYLALARQVGPPRRTVLQRLANQARSHCHTLQELIKNDPAITDRKR